MVAREIVVRAITCLRLKNVAVAVFMGVFILTHASLTWIGCLVDADFLIGHDADFGSHSSAHKARLICRISTLVESGHRLPAYSHSIFFLARFNIL